jgi:metal-dependent amidase/aminoacylase/carboxypeptidase family protein
MDFGYRRCYHHHGGAVFVGGGQMNNIIRASDEAVEQLRAELERAREIISDLSAKLNERFTRCTYCGYKIEYNADSEAETISAMFEINRHALTCVKDPRAKELEQAHARIGNLLAVIHGDGGQYQAEYGDLAATTDAILKWRGRGGAVDSG